MRLSYKLLIIALLPLLSACATPKGNEIISDDYEGVNRGIHSFNKGVDRIVARPASRAYAAVTPTPVDKAIVNVARTIALPNRIINKVLQFNLGGAAADTGRFAVNLTVGLLGTIDVASRLSFSDNPADFGQTLYVWGVKEGNYVELPFFGPSNARDATGKVVDILLLDPIGLIYPETRPVTLSVGALNALSRRDKLAPVLDDVYYNSEDSYTVGKTILTQNRRFSLEGKGGGFPQGGRPDKTRDGADEETQPNEEDSELLEDPFDDF